MKGKSVLILAVLLASTPVFAMQNFSGKVIQHKEWNTGNVVSSVKEINDDTALILNRINHLVKDAPEKDQIIVANSRMGNMDNPFVGSIAHIEGDSSFFILNGSSFQQKYTVRRMICAVMKSAPLACSEYTDEIVVDAQSRYWSHVKLSLLHTFQMSGDCYISIDTAIQSNTDTKLFAAEDDRMIVVH